MDGLALQLIRDRRFVSFSLLTIVFKNIGTPMFIAAQYND